MQIYYHFVADLDKLVPFRRKWVQCFANKYIVYAAFSLNIH